VEAPQRAHIYWVEVPDEPESKRRPALVVSSNVRNRLANDVIVCPISSRLRGAPTHVRLHSREGGLTATSEVKCEQVMTIRKTRIVAGPLGRPLSPGRMAQVERCILTALDIIL